MGHTSPSWLWTGIDGEGIGRNPHRYTLLCAATHDGKRVHVENQRGLKTRQCLDFLIDSIPNGAKCFAYSFQYDLTKMLADLPNWTLYNLFRPELRQRAEESERKKGPIPVKWGHYSLNLIQTRFTVKRYHQSPSGKWNHKTCVIWDIWKFFQSRFVKALELWSIDGIDIDHIRRMKDERAQFESLHPDQVREYCFAECEALGRLAKKLTEAHATAGLTLRDYYGAGSTAACMLAKMGITKHETPAKLLIPVMQAFAGGRFEHDVIGTIAGPVYGRDISSAYPYQLYSLPCLLHGKWRHTRRRKDITEAATALVRYRVVDHNIRSWGAFPYREPDGSICYPVNGSGYVWRDEFIAGERLHPESVRFVSAYVYNTDCDCQPFKKLAEYYRYRCQIGKEGPGIVVKLGVNSNYGKLAQSVGNPKFQCWIWAGMVTSGCRAMILDLIRLHSDPSNVLAIATDGVYSTELVPAPAPRDTGTADCRNSDGELCPLGGWETKNYPRGLMFARPGIYWPPNPTEEDFKQFRARGLGRAVLLRNHAAITEAWQSGRMSVTVANLQRFCGAKSSISRTAKPPFRYKRSPDYGQWVDKPVELSFDPMPKRERILPSGRLALRSVNPDVESAPYDRATAQESDDAQQMIASAIELAEQPDLDLVEF